MGLHHLSAALKLPMKSPAAKAVLLALSNYANDEDGYCWPSLDTLQLCTALSERTVRTALRELEALELVTTRRRKQATSVYHLALVHPRPADIAEVDPAKIIQDRHLSPPRPAAVAPEPEYNRNKDTARASRPASPAPAAGGGQDESDARAIPNDWRPDADTIKWFDEKFPEVDMDAQVEAFIIKNQTNGIPVRNPNSAFKGFCAIIPSLRLPPKARARPGTKAAEVEQNWSDTDARIAAMERTVSLYRKMGRDEEADDIESQLKWMKEKNR